MITLVQVFWNPVQLNSQKNPKHLVIKIQNVNIQVSITKLEQYKI